MKLSVIKALEIAGDIEAEEEISEAISRFTAPTDDKLRALGGVARAAMNVSEHYTDAVNHTALGKAIAAAAFLELTAQREAIRARLAPFVDLDATEGAPE